RIKPRNNQSKNLKKKSHNIDPSSTDPTYKLHSRIIKKLLIDNHPKNIEEVNTEILSEWQYQLKKETFSFQIK
ncbi:hypothetical protein BpHYR1_010444, partial [Brachionus plicatilis]